jgi:hypothetical protein
MKLKTIDEYYE